MATSDLNALLTKSPAQLTAHDVMAIAEAGLPEDAMTEFKETVPGGGWAASQELNKEGRDGLIKELVAFANAFGGTLYVGVEESANDPKRSIALKPLQQVGKLASVLETRLRDCVEPRLLSPEIVPVLTDPATGEGVLVVRVAPSPLAPHWNSCERRSYRRIGTSSQTISMLDIQSITLERARTSAEIERLFAERQQAFVGSRNDYSSRQARLLNIIGVIPNQPVPTDFAFFAIRCTAVPTLPITVANITARDDLKLGISLVLRAPDRRALSFPALTENQFFRPALRAWRYHRHEPARDGYLHQQLVRGDGVVETAFMQATGVKEPASLPIEYILTQAFGLLFALETFRVRTGMTNIPYEIELEIVTHGKVDVQYFVGEDQPGLLRFQQARTLFPRYLFEGRSRAAMLVDAIQNDLWNAMGRRVGKEIMSIQLDLPFMWEVVDWTPTPIQP